MNPHVGLVAQLKLRMKIGRFTGDSGDVWWDCGPFVGSCFRADTTPERSTAIELSDRRIDTSLASAS